MTFRWITRGPQLSLRTVIGGVDLAGIVAKCVNLILRQRDFRLQLACEVASCRCRTKGCELHFSHRKSVRFHGHMDSETGPRGKEEGNYAFGDRSASIHVEIAKCLSACQVHRFGAGYLCGSEACFLPTLSKSG